MKRTKISFNIETVPVQLQQYLNGAAIYDSSCSENAETLFVHGTERMFLKISKKGSLERECTMTAFLNKHQLAPSVIAFVADETNDYLLTEAITGEDGIAAEHLANPGKLATVYGECLRMLHSIATTDCPYKGRTYELLEEEKAIGGELESLDRFGYSPVDNVVIHGDYCLPNIILDHFSFKSFIDLGSGGVGDRHYDLFWGLWTLNYNLKTDHYNDLFLDAYGRFDVKPEGITYFAQLEKPTRSAT